jgi:hypothetical protein
MGYDIAMELWGIYDMLARIEALNGVNIGDMTRNA